MMTDWKESLSGSEKPKSVEEKVCEAPSRMVMVLSVPAGAVLLSLAPSMVIEIVLKDVEPSSSLMV